MQQGKIKKNTLRFALAFFAFVPYMVYGQTFRDLAKEVIRYLNLVAGFITILALLLFAFGVIKFIATAGDDQSRAAGKQLMVWGILSLFIMVSVWGIVEIISATFFG